jgi:hypothetical protein
MGWEKCWKLHGIRIPGGAGSGGTEAAKGLSQVTLPIIQLHLSVAKEEASKEKL